MPDRIHYLVCKPDFEIASTVTPKDYVEQLEKAYRLIQFCREKGIKDYVVYIVYYEERLLKEKGRDIEVGLEYVD